LAADPEKSKMKLPDLIDSDVQFLEDKMDEMDEQLPELKFFILPGGNTTVSYCHLARCVCRRAERITTNLDEHEFVAPIVMQYLNRLSDYLFVLGRKIAQDLGAEEQAWRPRI
jgi:cob(I)alamin adenosyltransferase